MAASLSAAARARAWLSSAQLPKPLLAEQGHVDREGQRAQPRVGADVAGRLLAADVLLAGRERQHEAALAVGVDGLARDPARHLADMLFAAGEQADVGAAEVEADADRLAFADHDVGAHFAGRLEQAERDRLGHHHDQQRALGVGGVGERLEVGDPAEDVGILHHHRAGLAVDARRPARRRRSSAVSVGAAVSSVSPVNLAIVLQTPT